LTGGRESVNVATVSRDPYRELEDRLFAEHRRATPEEVAAATSLFPQRRAKPAVKKKKRRTDGGPFAYQECWCQGCGQKMAKGTLIAVLRPKKGQGRRARLFHRCCAPPRATGRHNTLGHNARLANPETRAEQARRIAARSQ
jgi:hypothetical protein